MALLSIRDAAALLGQKSRGSLYRKIKAGELATVDGPDGPMLESEGLKERWANITRTRSDSTTGKHRKTSAAKTTTVVDLAPESMPTRRRADAELPEYNESRARSEYERANLLELERQQKEGLLLKREDVEQAWAGAVNITRTKLLGIPSVAKQRIPHLELEEVELLTSLIREALEELAAGEVNR